MNGNNILVEDWEIQLLIGCRNSRPRKKNSANLDRTSFLCRLVMDLADIYFIPNFLYEIHLVPKKCKNTNRKRRATHLVTGSWAAYITVEDHTRIKLLYLTREVGLAAQAS